MDCGFKIESINDEKKEIEPLSGNEIKKFCEDKTQVCLFCKKG